MANEKSSPAGRVRPLSEWLLAIPWLPERNGSGYQHLRGQAKGYPIELEAGPTGRWRASILNQTVTGREGNLSQAKVAALTVAASALLFDSLQGAY